MRLSIQEITPGIYYWKIGTSKFITHIKSIDVDCRGIHHDLINSSLKDRFWIYHDNEQIWSVPSKIANKYKLELL